MPAWNAEAVQRVAVTTTYTERPPTPNMVGPLLGEIIAAATEGIISLGNILREAQKCTGAAAPHLDTERHGADPSGVRDAAVLSVGRAFTRLCEGLNLSGLTFCQQELEHPGGLPAPRAAHGKK